MPSDEIACPSCTKLIKPAELKCRFCGTTLSQVALAAWVPDTSSGDEESPKDAPEYIPILGQSTINPPWWILGFIVIIVIIALLSRPSSVLTHFTPRGG